MPYRKLSTCHTDVVHIIYKVAEKINLGDIQYTILLGTDDIDTFYGGLYNVRITGVRESQRISHNIIIKRHHDPETRAIFRESYKREYAFYCRAAPLYLEIQRNFKIIEGLRIKFPNCIFASEEYEKECIVIMGLHEHRFEIHDRLQQTDLNHVVLAVKYLAKLHALSFVLENRKPEEFNELKQLCRKDVQYADPSNQSKSMRCLYEASVSVVSDPVAKEKLAELSRSLSLILHKCTLPVPKYSTICHGDCWNNNIFYKYKLGKPVDIILIDYQLMRYAAPVTDLAYYLYMTTDGKFLSKHYETVLNIYYGTLTAVLRECKLDVREIYPKKIFEEQLEKYSVLGLVEALISMMIITAPFEDALQMTEIKYQFCDERISETGNVVFRERVNDIVNDFLMIVTIGIIRWTLYCTNKMCKLSFVFSSCAI